MNKTEFLEYMESRMDKQPTLFLAKMVNQREKFTVVLKIINPYSSTPFYTTLASHKGKLSSDKAIKTLAKYQKWLDELKNNL